MNRKNVAVLLNLSIFLLTLGCVIAAPPELTTTPTPTATATPTTTQEPTATPVPTETPEPTATSTPTATPEPTETLAATTPPKVTPIPGWERFVGNEVELWLPESYIGGDLSEDMDLIAKRLRALGSDFEQMADVIEQNPDIYDLFVFDTETGETGFLTNVNVTSQEVLSIVELDFFIDLVLEQFPTQVEIIKREDIELTGYTSQRLTLETEVGDAVSKQWMYALKDDNMIWIITYTTDAEEFEQRRVEFEQSALTFRVLP